MQSSRTGALCHGLPAVGHSRNQAARLAFTLLELLIAIAIIGIMAGLILSVASSASRRAREAQVVADIQSLATGIAAFKQRFGVEPPSRITLYEKAAGWTTSTDPDAARSMGLIRQIWPQFDFNYTTESGVLDIDGDGATTGDGTNTTTGEIVITGAECLVFFLGGVPSPQASVGGIRPPMGFSKNPADPFSRASTSNRESFTEFDAGRLYLYQPPGGVSAHTMNTYADTLAHANQPTSTVFPYLYISSYGGQGYNINELVGTTPSLSTAPGYNNPPGNAFVDVYRQGSQSYWSSTSPFTQNTNTPSPPWNPNSFQIISPGRDQQYGTGGDYETANADTTLTATRGGERDNIANFSSGVLAP